MDVCCRWRVGLMVHCWRRQEQDDGWMGWELAGRPALQKGKGGRDGEREEEGHESLRSICTSSKEERKEGL